MPTLKQYLLEIKRQKDLYLLPENLKKDVSLLGVTGTFAGGEGSVKLFPTMADMRNDTNKEEGQLAIVYADSVRGLRVDDEFSVCMLPLSVVLPTAFGEYIYGEFQAVDSSSGVYGFIELEPTLMELNLHTTEGMINVQYTSANGITYTRTDGGAETIDIGASVKFNNRFEEWHNVIGNFISINSHSFSGFFSCVPDKNAPYYTFGLNDITVDTENQTIDIQHTEHSVAFSIVEKAILKIYELKGSDLSMWSEFVIYTDNSNIYIPLLRINNSRYGAGKDAVKVYDNKLFVDTTVTESGGDTFTLEQYKYNVENETIELDDTATIVTEDGIIGLDITNYEVVGTFEFDFNFEPEVTKSAIKVGYSSTFTSTNEFLTTKSFMQVYRLVYDYADTQLSLDNSNKLVDGNIAYGKNGIYVGTADYSDLSDGTALESDIVRGKVAYTSAGRLVGTIKEPSNPEIRQVTKNDEDEVLECTNNQQDTVIRNGTIQTIPYRTVVDAIGLSSNQLAQGVTILGITGTAPTDDGVGIIHNLNELPEVANEGDVRFFVNNDYTEYYGIYVYESYEWVEKIPTNILLEQDYNRALETVNEIRSVDQQG